MPLPASSHPCWLKLANGGFSKLKTEHLGTQLLAKRLERSPDPASAKAAEIQAFFAKWERTLTNEINQLTSI